MASVVEGLWRLPHRSLPAAVVDPLRKLGFPVPPDLSARASRSACAAAERLRSTTDEWRPALAAARTEHAAFASLAVGAPIAEREFWVDAAIIDYVTNQNAGASECTSPREAARLLSQARRAARIGTPPEAGPTHFEAAEALLPRLER